MTANRPPRRDAGKSNLVPAIVLAVGAILAGKFASGGGAATGATVTTVAEADAESSGHETSGESTAAESEKIVDQPPTTTKKAAEGAATTAGGHGAESTSAKGASSSKATTTTHGAVHWSYEGEAGPVHWKDLSADFEACEGTKQSPIDIGNPKVEQLADIKFTYINTPGTVVNNGHTIQVNLQSGSKIELDGKTYELVQFHIHAPSEHVVNGKSFPMEIHLVHKSSDGQLAVVGLMVKAGKENSRLTPAWKVLPNEEGKEEATKGPIELGLLLPSDHQTIRYDGSLTTPPCSEGVKWNIITTPVELSQAQIDAFTKLYKGNNRPIQERKDRVVTMDVGNDT
ncbi:MAG: carbonic anhydrase [Acidimicrobiia bacterium]